MYGGDQFTPHLLLRYGYTLDFFESFAPLTYRGIELPLPMIRPYHQFIRRMVDRHLHDLSYLQRKQQEWKLHTMQEVQARLQRLPAQKENLSLDAGRDVILLCGNYLDFARTYLSGHKVTLLSYYRHERNALKSETLSSRFQVYPLRKMLLTQKRPDRVKKKQKDTIAEFLELWRKQLKQAEQHPVFADPAFLQWMKEQLKRTIELAHALDQLIRNHPIKLIVEHNDLLSRSCLLALLAHKHGLPFLHVQHHLSSDASMIPTRASHYAVWGRNMAEWLICRGISPDIIHEVGAVRLEISEKTLLHTRQDLQKRFHLPANAFLVTYTTEQYCAAVNYQVMDWIRTAAARLPVFFMIKPHPDDGLSYEQYRSKNISLVPPDFHLYEILRSSDLVMTVSSTTAVEAAATGVGTLVLQPPMPYDYHLNYNGYAQHLVKADAGFVISSAEELIARLQQLLVDSGCRERLAMKSKHFLHSTLTIGDEKPGYRLAQLIKRLL